MSGVVSNPQITLPGAWPGNTHVSSAHNDTAIGSDQRKPVGYFPSYAITRTSGTVKRGAPRSIAAPRSGLLHGQALQPLASEMAESPSIKADPPAPGSLDPVAAIISSKADLQLSFNPGLATRYLSHHFWVAKRFSDDANPTLALRMVNMVAQKTQAAILRAHGDGGALSEDQKIEIGKKIEYVIDNTAATINTIVAASYYLEHADKDTIQRYENMECPVKEKILKPFFMYLRMASGFYLDPRYKNYAWMQIFREAECDPDQRGDLINNFVKSRKLSKLNSLSHISMQTMRHYIDLVDISRKHKKQYLQPLPNSEKITIHNPSVLVPINDMKRVIADRAQLYLEQERIQRKSDISSVPELDPEEIDATLVRIEHEQYANIEEKVKFYVNNFQEDFATNPSLIKDLNNVVTMHWADPDLQGQSPLLQIEHDTRPMTQIRETRRKFLIDMQKESQDACDAEQFNPVPGGTEAAKAARAGNMLKAAQLNIDRKLNDHSEAAHRDPVAHQEFMKWNAQISQDLVAMGAAERQIFADMGYRLSIKSEDFQTYKTRFFSDDVAAMPHHAMS